MLPSGRSRPAPGQSTPCRSYPHCNFSTGLHPAPAGRRGPQLPVHNGVGEDFPSRFENGTIFAFFSQTPKNCGKARHDGRVSKEPMGRTHRDRPVLQKEACNAAHTDNHRGHDSAGGHRWFGCRHGQAAEVRGPVERNRTAGASVRGPAPAESRDNPRRHNVVNTAPVSPPRASRGTSALRGTRGHPAWTQPGDGTVCAERGMNTFEHHLFADWTACASLLSQCDLDEADRRLAALITLMERCQDRTWLAGPC